MTAPLYDAYLLLARENAQRGSSWSSARQIEVVFDDSNVSFQMWPGVNELPFEDAPLHNLRDSPQDILTCLFS